MNIFKKYLPFFLVLSLFALPTSLVAQNASSAPITKKETSAPITTQGCDSRTGCTNSATGFKLGVRLNNPLKVNTIQDAVKFFLNTLMKIALPFIVIFFIWSGLKFILARGNPAEVTKAKNMFLYTIIGTLLILGAWAITNAIIGTVNTITS